MIEAFFELEGGKFAYYEYINGLPFRRWIAPRLAVAYDSESLDFYRLSYLEELMEWASSQRTHLTAEFAKRLAVSALPTDVRIQELNRLLEDHSYCTLFLTKFGVV